MALIPVYGSEPKADDEGIHFQMEAPSGKIVRCSVQPDVFKDLAEDNDTNRLKFFSDHLSKFHDIASKIHENRDPKSDEAVNIRYRNLHTWGFTVEDFKG